MKSAYAVAGLLCLGLIGQSTWAATAASVEAGKSIYRKGVLASGAPLEGLRPMGAGLKGADAACVNCHRRSGLGSVEGPLFIPPIRGDYLFHAREATNQEPVLGYVQSMHGNRDPYTDATLKRAIRAGLDSQGKPLAALMPRFALDDTDMEALIDYLKSLGQSPVPGVTPTMLKFATVVTPDADPATRQGVLAVLRQYVVDKNSFPWVASPPLRTSGKTMFSKVLYVANRHWQLSVWQLTGPADGWAAQLKRDYAREPVVALLSGVGGRDWRPVHDFCEREEIPCLFPNVEVPVVDDGDVYSLYFSRGVPLEADLIGRKLKDSLKARPRATVLQIYRADDNGEAGARELAAALRSSGVTLRSEVLAAGHTGKGLKEALRRASTADALVLWLRPADLAALGKAPVALPPVYLSGLLGGLENAPLPPSWRPLARMAYLFDLPDRRVVRVDYPLGWFRFSHIPVVAMQPQVDTYLACQILTETLRHISDVTDRDYLLERMQPILDHRLLTGYYPRLSIATGQTLASKGGYIVRFVGATGNKLAADGDWTTP